MPSFKVSLLDYGAGNVRSVRNAILAQGYDIVDITDAAQINDSQVIIFPGVGSFGSAMAILREKGYQDALIEYLKHHDRPFLGICLGMQTLFESSDETNFENEVSSLPTSKTSIPGLGVIPGRVVKFDETKTAVPHIGWNGRILYQNSPVFKYVPDDEDVYFVHSYYAKVTDENQDWVLSTTTYGGHDFVSSIQKGAIVATQFHPEKSGDTGLRILKGFLEAVEQKTLCQTRSIPADMRKGTTQLAKRIVVALDVRTNDDGDLVVTKGDQYDVREKHIVEDNDTVAPEIGVTTITNGSTQSRRRAVRNLGKPVSLARRYYQEGADEIAFLNITSFRQGVIEDMPMLQVLTEASKNIFVPLTVGGGIRQYTDPESGQTWSALEVASRYFRAGADKVSIGSDAVDASEAFLASGGVKTGKTSIEQISRVYGVQAVVVSIDPKRVYVESRNNVTNDRHVVIELEPDQVGPNGERFCWYQCTVKGGRETRDVCAVTVAKITEQLGAGEIMLNCIDMDGQGQGFDLALMKAVSEAVSIPVIASSGAGSAQHFTDVFTKTNVQAALAAGMFHRHEVEIEAVKDHLRQNGLPARRHAQ